MPRKSKYPKLRTEVRRSADGTKTWTCYYYDMRGTGQKNIALGTDRDEALKKWDEIHNERPRIAGTLEEAFKAWERDVLPTYTNKGTRKNYTVSLKRLRPHFGKATWDGVRFVHLVGYLNRSSKKRQANHDMALLSVVWHWAAKVGLTEVPWPAANMSKSRWKNPEHAREFEVTDELFNAVYAHADQVLKDCMDLATATCMRLTDCRTIALPTGDVLRLKAHKTGKKADFDLSVSKVLPELIARRRSYRADHLMLLSTPTGRKVSEHMLRARWDAAREAAAKAHPELAEQIKALWLRDMRKRGAQLTGSLAKAREMLQHDKEDTTRRHYQPVTKLKPTR